MSLGEPKKLMIKFLGHIMPTETGHAEVHVETSGILLEGGQQFVYAARPRVAPEGFKVDHRKHSPHFVWITDAEPPSPCSRPFTFLKGNFRYVLKILEVHISIELDETELCGRATTFSVSGGRQPQLMQELPVS